MKPRSLFLLLALLAAGAVGWWLLAARDAGQAAPLPTGTSVREAPQAELQGGAAQPPELERLARITQARERRAASPEAPAAAPAQPADGAEPDLVIDALAELEEQAAAGDAVAACRAASLLAACSSLPPSADSPFRQRMLDDLRERVRTSTGNARALAESSLETMERENAWARRCAGVDDAVLALQPSLDVRAAKLGDPRAAERFVSGSGLRMGDLVADPSLAQFYRDNAWPLFQQLFQAGEESAVWMWMEAVRNQSRTALWTVLPDDWRDRDVAYGLGHRMMQRRGPGWEPRPGNPALDIGPEADARAEALWNQYFRDRPPDADANGSRAQRIRFGRDRRLQGDEHCQTLGEPQLR